jgi:hypothetical protein
MLSCLCATQASSKRSNNDSDKSQQVLHRRRFKLIEMADDGPPFDDNDLINDFNEEDDYFPEEFEEDPYMDAGEIAKPDSVPTNDGNAAAVDAPATDPDTFLANIRTKDVHFYEDQDLLRQDEEEGDLADRDSSDIPAQVVMVSSSVPIADKNLYSFDR